MKSFKSRVTIPSALPEWDGVTFTIRRPTEGLRIRMREQLAAALEQLREAIGEARAVDESGENDAASTVKLQKISDRIEFLQGNQIDIAHLRASLVKVEGLEIDDAPATVESLIENGPRELYVEILQAIRKESGLSESERKNSESPITSGVQEDGRTKDTTVPPASETDTTSTAIATSIFPPP